MAFLFKSKKNQDRALGSRDGPPSSQTSSIQSASGRATRDEKNALQHRSTPTGSITSVGDDAGSIGSPDQPYPRRNPSVDQAPQQQGPSDLPFRNGPQATQPTTSSPNASLYPWSQRRINYTTSHPSPFPRYGAAVNSVSSKEGDIYVMGGLINSSTVKGDLWLIEAGQNMSCYPLATTQEGPGPRVGHASLLVGNAFIVYGGDTKIEETDVLDETLYLLNTSTRQWSRALPAGQRPSGRYGHSLNILGSRIYIFGGQVEGYFMNDLAAFDLNQLQMPNNRWEMLIPNSDGAVAAGGRVPPARTNHTMVTFNDRMYLFGGTNGYQWFNDVWCYDPATNEWTQLDCIGYIPVPREGHAAAIVDEVMYIFGGRTEEGADLGDLAAFRITSRRWYTFQNMGPSPSPRSGHSMTTVGKSVVVVGGEPSSATSNIGDLGILYLLDTTKIRYPNDAQAQSQRLPQQATRRPSAGDSATASRHLPSRDGSAGPDPKRTPSNGTELNGGGAAAAAAAVSKLPRAAGSSPPAGPPPQGPAPSKPVAAPPASNQGRTRGPSVEREGLGPGPQQAANAVQNALVRDATSRGTESPVPEGRRTPTQQTVRGPAPKPEPVVSEPPKAKAPVVAAPMAAAAVAAASKQAVRSQGPVESNTADPTSKGLTNRPASPPPPTRQPSNPLSRRSSGRNSQTVALLKELDSARNRNAWYASELELARKAGYSPNATLSPVFDSRAAETFDDEDKPLIEALLAMRSELANVQSAVDKQAVLAAKQIAEAEKQRDVAIQEAVYAKAKLAAQMSGSAASTPQLEGGDRDLDGRSTEVGRKLASALNFQKDLQAQMEMARAELEAERRARQLAEDTVNASQRRMGELESYKSSTSPELERLKAELHRIQREAREQSVQRADAVAAMQLLQVEKKEFESRYHETVGTSKEQNGTFESLRAAVASSAETKALLERKLAEERSQREKLEAKLTKITSEYEASTAELVKATQRLRDAEELAEKHAKEAKSHHQVVLAGFEKMSATREAPGSNKASEDRIVALQGQLNAANVLVKKYQQEADAAADKLRSAEERIAGLEVYQEQASREGVAIRRQLQAALKETQSLQAANSDLKHQLSNQQLETNAMTVQHNTLKDILVERGISPSNVGSRTRGGTMGSPRENSPEQSRIRDLEQQLAAVVSSSEENRRHLEAQQETSETAYREKLAQLENDYQSAVHYVKGTEKMLKQLKDQLSRYKNDNSRLKAEIETLEERVEAADASGGNGAAAADWEAERSALEGKIEKLQAEVRTSKTDLEKQLVAVKKDLDAAKKERDAAAKGSEDAVQKLTANRRDIEQLRQENALLERRAQDAEQKVSLLLDQVETSVDNYRRRSRQVPSGSSELINNAANGTNGMTMGHARQESSEAESVYGGGIDARNSTALDNLANELETLRSHWEATNKNYRLSNAFDFDTNVTTARKDEDVGLGLSESLADWRKRLDVEEHSGHPGGDASVGRSRSDRP